VPVAPSPADLLEQFIAEAQAQRATLRFDDGNVTEAQAHGAMAMADVVLRYAAQAFRDTFIDGAAGDALTALVDDHYNIQRDPATSSSVTERFTRTSGGAGGTIAAGTTIASVQQADGSEVRFTTDAAIVVPNAANGPFDRRVHLHRDRAGGQREGRHAHAARRSGLRRHVHRDEPGRRRRRQRRRERRAAPHARAQLLDDAAPRDPRRARVRGAPGRVGAHLARDRGPRHRPRDRRGVRQRRQQHRADDLGRSRRARELACRGTVLTVVGGTPLLVDVVGTMDVDAGIDRAVLSPLVIAAITARMKKQRQGELMHLDSIKAAGIAVDPDGINAINLTTPTDTVTPGPAQVVRPGTISVS
jgi:hypothetical protein